MSEWKIAKLTEVAAVFNGKTPSKLEQRTEGHPVLKIKDVSELGEYRGKFESFVDPELATKFANEQVQEGDTLILNAAHNADYVASKTYHAQPATFGALATGEWLIVRPDRKALDAKFAHHWVNSTRTGTNSAISLTEFIFIRKTLLVCKSPFRH
jgi:type I restriction enzyme S subunit